MHILVLKALEDQLQIMRQDGDQVHRGQHASPKALEIGGGGQAQQVLQGEEGDAGGFHVLAVEPASGLAGRRLQEKCNLCEFGAAGLQTSCDGSHDLF